MFAELRFYIILGLVGGVIYSAPCNGYMHRGLFERCTARYWLCECAFLLRSQTLSPSTFFGPVIVIRF